MRTFQEATEAVETYSPAEEAFNSRRRSIGLVLGPVAFLALLLAPLPLPPPAQGVAGSRSRRNTAQ